MNPSYKEPSFDDTRTRRAWWSVALAAALAAGAWAWGNYGHLASSASSSRGAAPTGTAFPWQRSGRSEPLAATPPDWRTAAVPSPTDRSLSVDAQGHLQVTRSLRNLFDAFLGPPGTPTPADARARIVAALHQQLPAAAAVQAQALLDQYLAYNAALQDLDRSDHASGPGADDRLSRLHVIEDLRARHFSATEQQAFFGDDLAWQRYAIAHDQVMQDPTLNVVDKALRISQLRAQLPAAWLAQLNPANTALDVDTLTDQWRASKGSAQELRAMREALVGVTGADQLEAQDRQAQVWGRQLSSFGEQIKATMADPSLSEVQRQQALAELRKQNLAELERLGSLPPGSLKP